MKKTDPPSAALALVGMSVREANARTATPNPSVGEGSNLPPRIADHELLRLIGSGSYGEVWLARNVFGESRAVKIVSRKSFEDDRPFQREFDGIRKFEPISRSHPSQLAILHVGRNEADGYFYYVMELADDVGAVPSSGSRVSGSQRPANSNQPETYSPHTLKLELKRRAPLPPAECVRLGLALAEALGHLHKHGLVHRDIKPSNIVFVGGVPKLADIGLVTDVDASRSFVGTEGYLPPEGPGTPQADIYGLGKVLYELCTGKDRKDYPALPSDLRERSESEQRELLELNAVLVKACATEPRQRYQSAEELHAELKLLERGESVKTKRTWERRRSIARKFGLATICALFAWLAIHWAGIRLNTSGTQEAQRWCREGRFLLNQNTHDAANKAMICFEKAITADPNCAPAFAGLSEGYRWKGDWNKAREVALRAVQIDDRLGEAHAELAIIKRTVDWDWAGAEAEFKRAIELNPKHWVAGIYYAGLLVGLGRFEEGLAVSRRTVEANPLSDVVLNEYGGMLYYTRRYDEAIEVSNRVLAMNRNFDQAYFHLWLAYMQKGMYEEAISALERRVMLLSGNLEHFAAAKEAFRAGGIQAFFRKTLEFDLPKTAKMGSLPFADVYSQLNEPDAAFEWLGKAVEAREARLQFLKVDPRLDNLRSDSRFAEVLKRVGLPP